MGQAQAVRNESFRVAISGASGFVGTRLTRFLADRGHRIQRLMRDRSRMQIGDVYWNPAQAEIDAAGLETIDAVVHLAGENVAGGRWNDARKAAIRDSRVAGTALLSRTLAELRSPPGVLIAASAVGYYGDRGAEELTEESGLGHGFLADVTRDWETATQPARGVGVRVVNLRTGTVLGRAGGALAKLLTPFKLGLGGRVGSGRQYMSWIALADLVRAIEHLLSANDVSGPVNGVAPTPVTNAEFTRTLGRALGRPTACPLPAPLVRLLFGQMGRELLLASTRALPKKLQASGFSFEYPDLEAALRAELCA